MDDKFCTECGNLLYPREDSGEKTLFLACRNCDHIQEAKSHLLHMKRFGTLRASIEQYARDLVQDRTLPSIKINCTKCGFGSGLYFQSEDNREDVALSIFYVCRGCYYFWS